MGDNVLQFLSIMGRKSNRGTKNGNLPDAYLFESSKWRTPSRPSHSTTTFTRTGICNSKRYEVSALKMSTGSVGGSNSRIGMGMKLLLVSPVASRQSSRTHDRHKVYELPARACALGQRHFVFVLFFNDATNEGVWVSHHLCSAPQRYRWRSRSATTQFDSRGTKL